MIYIAAALYSEGKPFIDGLGLKKTEENKIRIFSNDGFMLIITGVGILESAVSLSYALGRFLPSKNDVFINVGCCGGGRAGEMYVCNKITDAASGRDIYPDMIYDSGLEEKHLISYPKPQRDIPAGVLADTEGYGLCAAALGHFYAHRMFFFKISSDSGDYEGVTAGDIAGLVKKHSGFIADFAMSVHSAERDREFCFTERENAEIEGLGLTFANTLKVKRLLKYYKLRGGDVSALIGHCPSVSLKREEGELVERIRSIVL